ncbi:MerR family transcriptional regulator [Kitasatospora sp. NBC_01287]|uniref:DNA polymerase III subunit beta family protein n=1 Tax=Kitasatospora sp. NBC_01287 TaxID=2903573 RepID=UPI00224FB55F|nr:MerR family transcriptional regulator [Kitasatospora sp. NBC_01287]MCX4748218.1 MerR family transcriptional regulator [Kitasatospora sp. NBC_01287]
MRSIGQLARESGLTVSALRFYDSAGVFGPARVDPQTGYRWYAPDQLADARLLCRLRRVGLPLAGIRLVLAAPSDARAAHEVLDAHLRRLEDGLADARRELSQVRTLIDQREHMMTTTGPTDPATPAGAAHVLSAARLAVAGSDLVAALAAVRFAVSRDAELPMLGGVLFDFDPDGAELRLVATDRYRLAVGTAAARAAAGTGFSVLVPAVLADEIGELATDAAELTVVVEGATVTAEAGGRRVTGERLDLDFPDYRRLLRLRHTHRVELPADALRRAVVDGATRPFTPERGARLGAAPAAEVPLTVLAVGQDGELRVVGAGPGDASGVEPRGAGEEAAGPGAGELRVAVNQEFLLEALTAGAMDQLILELGGAISPLAIRSAGGPAGNYSILMPVRLT